MKYKIIIRQTQLKNASLADYQCVYVALYCGAEAAVLLALLVDVKRVVTV